MMGWERDAGRGQGSFVTFLTPGDTQKEGKGDVLRWSSCPGQALLGISRLFLYCIMNQSENVSGSVV